MKTEEKEKPLEIVAPPIRHACPLSVEQASDLVLGHKEIEDGFVQHTESLDKSPLVRVPGGAGAWQFTHRRGFQYRVYIRTDKAMADVSGDNLLDVIRQAFAKLKLQPPAGLPNA